MKPLQASSGDLIADRRADFAEMLHAAGDHAPAADLMLEALALAPGWAAGWFLLGEMQEAAGRTGQAAFAWKKVLELDPSDRLGATFCAQRVIDFAEQAHRVGREVANA